MNQLRLEPGVAEALAGGQPVVALESALITHGFSSPANLHIAQRMEAAVRQQGALPAVVAVIDGEPRIGLTGAELAHLASARLEPHPDHRPPPRKISLRDLPLAVAQGMTGGTTVAATMHLAWLAGIQVFATGGIGGVHRHHPEDVSADLTALGSIPIIVVCSGAKAILDLPRTREILETRGVPVVGYCTDVFPAFYSRQSGLPIDASVGTPEEVAQFAAARAALDLSTALLVCVPVPREEELPAPEAEVVIDRALSEVDTAAISGSDLTPFLLARIVELTGGRARRANEALLVNNARVAADVALAVAD